jgi:hypothetical protein
LLHVKAIVASDSCVSSRVPQLEENLPFRASIRTHRAFDRRLATRDRTGSKRSAARSAASVS